MPDIFRELSAVGALYDELEQVLGTARQSLDITGSADNPCFRSLESIVERSSAAGRILAELSQSWTEERRRLDPNEGARLAGRAQNLRQRALCLQEQLGQLEIGLRKVRDATQASLGEIHNGSRFLKSVMPSSSREPRFLDTRE